ncbi:MAG: hypothetical protein OXH58_08935 [Acidimicrobiaceae bacterium]|nr:hypothetical protein [Acidimicrobiaceae bacterium]MDE0656685.1 hypothetical protein [Acidimicrobiaceae bacterium]
MTDFPNMTDFGRPVAGDPQLGADDIRRLFDQVSTHLRDTGSVGHHLMIAGGAALALMWQDRTTRDVDVLEHRFRAPAGPSDQRRTNAVDFISMRFPAELSRAARLVADAEGLRRNWLNGAAAIFTPDCELDPRVLHRNDPLTVEAPAPAVLLAMKLYAARPTDLQDAARLTSDTNLTYPDELYTLVTDAYGADALTDTTIDFAHHALKLAQRDTPGRHQQPPDRGLSTGR